LTKTSQLSLITQKPTGNAEIFVPIFAILHSPEWKKNRPLGRRWEITEDPLSQGVQKAGK